MAEYLEVEKARDHPGLRLVLTAGVPGPWGEAARALFHVKRVPFVRVRQVAGAANEELVAWTGHRNAPLAVWRDERARSGWAEILLLAERLAPEPALVPADPHERALLFGLGHEICGEGGLGWSRRLMMFASALGGGARAAGAGEAIARMTGQYGYDRAAAAAAPRRAAQVLGLLADQLRAQRARGSRFLLGDALSAVDLYWATFAVMVAPLPEALCPMPELVRRQYEVHDPALRAALDPALLAHRDFVYGEYLELPVDC